ncbi:uncharacterized protein G2W53_037206 [Senna tora]|uniref:Uncharacterized protein n=1 Tax=Senna tora TaxID=362788 RepID=A0A834SVU5_9FABA|nr:uncharacterized protein G2W53_037206 [Senna tora]
MEAFPFPPSVLILGFVLSTKMSRAFSFDFEDLPSSSPSRDRASRDRNRGKDREGRSLKVKEARSKRSGGGRNSRHSSPRDPLPLKDQWRVLKATSRMVSPEVVREPPPIVPSAKPPLGVVTSSAHTGASTISTSIPLPRSTEVVKFYSSGDTMEVGRSL